MIESQIQPMIAANYCRPPAKIVSCTIESWAARECASSVVGVGTWQFGGEWAHDFSQTEVDQILDQAAACGINFIDTAECYGDHLSERLIGDYLSRHDRSQWIVATKFGHYFHSFMRRTDDYSVDAARLQLESSLRSLRVETIDLYQFHSGSGRFIPQRRTLDDAR